MVLDIALGILTAIGIIIGVVMLVVLLIRLYHKIGDWFSNIGQWVHETKGKDEFVGTIALILIIVVVIAVMNFINR